MTFIDFRKVTPVLGSKGQSIDSSIMACELPNHLSAVVCDFIQTCIRPRASFRTLLACPCPYGLTPCLSRSYIPLEDEFVGATGHEFAVVVSNPGNGRSQRPSFRATCYVSSSLSTSTIFHVFAKSQYIIDFLIVAARKLFDVLTTVRVPESHRLVLHAEAFHGNMCDLTVGQCLENYLKLGQLGIRRSEKMNSFTA